MILKKPYAFLIKRFKLIHILLTLCAIYLVTKVNGMLDFYNGILEGTFGKLDVEKYFGNFYVLVVILAIVISFIVLMLMRYKKKSYFFYIIMIAYFLAISLLIGFSIDGIYQIYISGMDTKTLLLHRDVLKIVSFIQYVFVFMCLVRGLGFDIKKFNFADDLVDLNVDITDDEEVELTVGGVEVYRRKLYRNIREFKYYYLENKHMINIILCLIVFACLGGYLIDSLIINRVYKTNDVFKYDDFSYKLLSTYVTNVDYDGRMVSYDDKSFVLVKMNVINNGTKREINMANLILKVGDKSYSSNIKTSKFKDLGKVYVNQKVDNSDTYLFVYDIPNSEIKNKMVMNFGNDKNVKLNPVYLDEIKDAGSYKLGSNMDMSKSFYGVGNINISSYEVANKFDYSYTYQVLGEDYDGNITITSVNNTIMKLVLSGNYPGQFDKYTFLNKYAKLKYVIDDKEYTSSVFDDKTPGSYNEGLYLVVDKEIEKASSIWFDITIRNMSYIYKLK